MNTYNYDDAMVTNSFSFYSPPAVYSPPPSSSSADTPSFSSVEVAAVAVAPSPNHHHNQHVGSSEFSVPQQQQQQPSCFAFFGKRRRDLRDGALLSSSFPHFISQEDETDEDDMEGDSSMQDGLGTNQPYPRWKRMRTSYSSSSGGHSPAVATTTTAYNINCDSHNHTTTMVDMSMSIESKPASTAATAPVVPWWKQAPKKTLSKTATRATTTSVAPNGKDLLCIVCQTVVVDGESRYEMAVADDEPNDCVMPPNALLAYLTPRGGGGGRSSSVATLTPPMASHHQPPPHRDGGSGHRAQSCTFCERTACPNCTQNCHECQQVFCAFCVTEDYHHGPYARTVCGECSQEGNKENTDIAVAAVSSSSATVSSSSSSSVGAADDDMMCD